jgi:LCP family protein required for cell wall assembly
VLIRVLLAAAAAAVLFIGAFTGLFLERQRAYDRNIRRIPGAFPAESDRPARTAGRAQNWLLVCSDRRADRATTGRDANQPLWRYGAQRADTIMLVHLPADRDRAYLVSFPRDSWVPIQGHGKVKLNAAFSFGGPPLLIATIEGLTGVRVDHFAILDFEGFKSMADALGGVNVRVVRTVRDPARQVVWPAGTTIWTERGRWTSCANATTCRVVTWAASSASRRSSRRWPGRWWRGARWPTRSSSMPCWRPSPRL